MSRFLITSNIDIKKLKADNVKDALKEFDEKMYYERQPHPGGPIKDWFLCEIVAIEGNWNEPKGFKILRTCSDTPTEVKK